ncbi:MAG TPA: hypothetical protein VEL05_07740, partial [Candidatus Acidoferrum sp.]|nr:hypothetical protein [Candidatus Acidoferrum sp.]
RPGGTPNGYQPPAEAPAGKRGSGDDDVTMVADREKLLRPPGKSNGEDSIDVALSELEHEN